MGTRNNTHRAPLLAAILAVALGTLTYAAGTEEEASPGQSSRASVTARIEYLEGEVFVDGAEATLGMVVGAGSTLETGPDGVADVVFGAGNLLQVQENTLLRLDLSDAANGLSIEEGRIAAVFERLESVGIGEADPFRIRTPTTVAGVRGTVFFAAVESVDVTYVCTCVGTLEFDVAGGMAITGTRHAANRFIRDGSSVRVQEALELYHTTAGLNALADKVDVTIPWGPPEA